MALQTKTFFFFLSLQLIIFVHSIYIKQLNKAKVCYWKTKTSSTCLLVDQQNMVTMHNKVNDLLSFIVMAYK